MSKLNSDVLYLIFEELQYDKKAISSCLSVSKTWCKNIVPILWKDPWKYLKKERELLLSNVIISHLSDETRNDLENKRIHSLANPYRRPLFDYISFCRHLHLNQIERIIKIIDTHVYFGAFGTIRNEIFNLFINENTKFTHLYVTYKFDFQIHLIPGAKRCFSGLKFLCCNTSVNDNVLAGLPELCKSINELELFIEYNGSNYGIVKLIESSKKLYSISILSSYSPYRNTDKSFYTILENSLAKHANDIQYFKLKQPVTKILSSFVNLKRLELEGTNFHSNLEWNCLDNLSLPFLQILNAKYVPIKVLTDLIENTCGNLIEISINNLNRNDDVSNKRIIQAIYQNCPKLKFLRLCIMFSNILEFKKLLVNCQYLDGLYINNMRNVSDLDNLFEILIKSSPTGLFKFKFFSVGTLKLESLKFFFDNWKGKHPVLLQTMGGSEHVDLIEKYKAEGIVKKYDNDMSNFEEFEWIKKID